MWSRVILQLKPPIVVVLARLPKGSIILESNHGS